MAQYVDIMTDAGFKAVFQDKQVTIKFLNAALAGERQIKDITYLDKEIKPETVENRTIIFDLLLRGRVRGQVHPRDAELSPALFL